MTKTTVTPLIQPGEFCNQLTSVLRSGAQALLTRAIEAEVAGFVACHAQEQLEDGRARLVRHGHLPGREIQTGIGAVKIRQPRVRDHAGKERDRLLFLTFFDFPAEHWKHIRTTNPIESTFATVRHRTKKTSCQNLFKASHSRTGSRQSKTKPKTPPDDLRHQLLRLTRNLSL
jgi:hypothetical protein